MVLGTLQCCGEMLLLMSAQTFACASCALSIRSALLQGNISSSARSVLDLTVLLIRMLLTAVPQSASTPRELQPGEDTSDNKIGATHPVQIFVVNLTRRAELTVDLHENNTASRCAMYISTCDPQPTVKTALWRCESSLPKKSITILPVDQGYHEGPCYISVHYTATSGNVFFSLKTRMRETFQARWYTEENDSMYEGAWLQQFRHGYGRCVYRPPPHLIPQSTTTSGGEESTNTSDRSIMENAVDFGTAEGPIVLPLPSTQSEVYEGEWKMGDKDGNGIYQWQDKSYVGSWRGGKRNGRGSLCKADGSKYTGEWRDDAKSGYGVQYFSNGTRYEGDWYKNKRHGHGLFVYATGLKIVGRWEADILVSEVTATFTDGTTYEGGWQDDARHGERGVYKDAVGLVYEGSWVQDKRHGKGIWHLPRSVKFRGTWVQDARQDEGGEFMFPNQDQYVGGWDEERHVRHGSGTCRFHTGDTFTGQWVNDQMCGQGRMDYADGRVYDGAWKSNRRHGEGHFVTPEGTYDGSYANDARQGKGTMRYSDGSHYVGLWQDDYRHGDAAEYYDAQNNIFYRITFQSDAMVGHGEVEYRSLNEVYKGEFQANVRHGEGTLTMSTGDAYTGRWKDDVREDGHGVCVFANGDKYEGEWVDRRRSGRGTCWFRDTSRYEGEWADDLPCGEGTLFTRSGDQITSMWRGGERVDGRGKCVFANGNVYEGEWMHNEPHGQGTLVYPDGTVFEGRFEHGVYRL